MHRTRDDTHTALANQLVDAVLPTKYIAYVELALHAIQPLIVARRYHPSQCENARFSDY